VRIGGDASVVMAESAFFNRPLHRPRIAAHFGSAGGSTREKRQGSTGRRLQRGPTAGSWPDVVGMMWENAREVIKATNPYLNVKMWAPPYKVKHERAHIASRHTSRVLVKVDGAGRVIAVPRRG